MDATSQAFFHSHYQSIPDSLAVLHAFTYIKGRDVTVLWSINDHRVRMPPRNTTRLTA
jgi:hypothetical protein